jgi:endonuclease/exonuclease/phosphatase family metal-dependent hydrolase
VDAIGILAHKDLIIAGDLNFTTSSAEVWGHSVLQDSLAGFFKSFFFFNSLVDVAPAEIVPTWRNDRSGDDSIAKQLDRIYVPGDLIASNQRYRTWVQFPFLSDHALVFLEFGVGIPAVACPLKLNLVWIGEDSFVEMVKDV